MYKCDCWAFILQNIAFLKRYTGEGGEVKFRSFIHVQYDQRRYALDSREQKVKAQICESDFVQKDHHVTLMTTADLVFSLKKRTEWQAHAPQNKQPVDKQGSNLEMGNNVFFLRFPKM